MKEGWSRGPDPNVSTRFLVAFLAAIALLACLWSPARSQPLPDFVAVAPPPAGLVSSTNATVPHAGLLWAVKLEASPAVQEERIRQAIAGRDWVVWSEAQFTSCPRLFEIARSIDPGLEQFVSVNGWGVFDNGSAYWPSHKLITAVVEESNGWLEDANGTQLRTSFGIALFDIRVAAVREILVATTRKLLERTGADGVFVDECYADDWPSHYSGRDLSVGIPGEEPSLGWMPATRNFLRRTWARQTVINGTFRTSDAPGIITGRYVQNANRAQPGTVIVWLATEASIIPDERRKVCIQVSASESLFWQGIAAAYPGTAVQEEPPPPTNQFDIFRPCVVLKDVSIDVVLEPRAVSVHGGE